MLSVERAAPAKVIRCSLGKHAGDSVVLALLGGINRRANSRKMLNKID